MIRQAVMTDLPDIVDILLALSKRADFIGVPDPDPQSVATTVAQMIVLAEHAVFVVDDDGVIGTAGLLTSPRWENHAERTVLTLFLWTPKDGRDLLTACEMWLRERGYERNAVSAVRGMQTKATCRRYRMLGYRESERMFVKEL